MMKALFIFLIFTTFTDAAFAQFAHDDSTRYLYDNRTYGTRGFASRIDSDFLFPTYPSGRTFSTQTAAHLYWVAPADQLHVFYAGHDYVFSTGGGTVTGAANGLSVDGSNVILGYAGALPNLYRSVFIKTGVFNTFGVNYDSVAANGGADSIVGPYFVVGPQSPFATGPFFSGGYKNGPNTLNNNVEADATGVSLNTLFTDGATSFLFIGDNSFQMLMNDGATVQYGTSLTPATMQLSSPGGIYLVDNAANILLSSVITGRVTGGNNIDQLDAGNSFSFRHLAAYGDSIAAVGGSITVTFNANLSVTPSVPAGYSTSGEDASFTLKFTTGTVTASTDSVIARISLVTGSESSYSVMCMPAGNKASGLAYSLMQPFYTIVTGQTFNLCSATTNSTTAFASNTTYYFSFHIIDHTTQ